MLYSNSSGGSDRLRYATPSRTNPDCVIERRNDAKRVLTSGVKRVDTAPLPHTREATARS